MTEDEIAWRLYACAVALKSGAGVDEVTDIAKVPYEEACEVGWEDVAAALCTLASSLTEELARSAGRSLVDVIDSMKSEMGVVS